MAIGFSGDEYGEQYWNSQNTNILSHRIPISN